MKKLLLLLLCTSMQAAFAQSGKIDWKADLENLTKELPEKHCNFFTARSKGEYVSGIEAIKAESERLTDFQVALKTQQLIARFGDSHTMLQFFQLIDQTQILPLGTLWVSDGLYITKTTPENKEILGLRIVAITDTPIATVIASLSTLFTIDNQAIVKSIVPETVMSLQALEHFGFADSRQVKLMLSDGKTQVVKPIHPDNAFVKFRPDSLAFATANRKVLFTSRYFPEDRIYYMLYNKCHSRELAAERGDAEAAQKLPSFEAFTRKAFETLNDKPVDKLIFDMRYNGGGNSSQGTEFVERLAQALKQHPQVAVYVVLGRDTFSSAILNAMDFKQLTNAVFVGEETAGKPNHFGEVRSFQLPSSKVLVNYSTKNFNRSEKEIETIEPDMSIEMSFADFKKGVDPVFEWINALLQRIPAVCTGIPFTRPSRCSGPLQGPTSA